MTTHTKSRRGRLPGDRGFTLIELMVVIVILGALVALVGPNVWKALVDSTRGTVEAQISNFNQAIGMYRMEHRTLPGSLQDLVASSTKNSEPYLSEGRVPDDPWGQPYDYHVTNQGKGEYTITSYGDDKQAGTADDIIYNSIGGFK